MNGESIPHTPAADPAQGVDAVEHLVVAPGHGEGLRGLEKSALARDVLDGLGERRAAQQLAHRFVQQAARLAEGQGAKMGTDQRREKYSLPTGKALDKAGLGPIGMRSAALGGSCRGVMVSVPTGSWFAAAPGL